MASWGPGNLPQNGPKRIVHLWSRQVSTRYSAVTSFARQQQIKFQDVSKNLAASFKVKNRYFCQQKIPTSVTKMPVGPHDSLAKLGQLLDIRKRQRALSLPGNNSHHLATQTWVTCADYNPRRPGTT
ncbi:hypothetical protein Bbelb_013450 [Branchiostoma belcheri]|nr:hypothetical protein Bbelb_013450 [Branchiostoma belcheri]